jgi:hypothetical protein
MGRVVMATEQDYWNQMYANACDQSAPDTLVQNAALTGENMILRQRVAELEKERDEAIANEGRVCADCNDSGWLENRVDGRYPCTCMTESEPYQLLESQLATCERDAERYRRLKNHLSLGPRPHICITVNTGNDWSRVSEIDELDGVIDATGKGAW